MSFDYSVCKESDIKRLILELYLGNDMEYTFTHWKLDALKDISTLGCFPFTWDLLKRADISMDFAMEWIEEQYKKFNSEDKGNEDSESENK